MGKQCLLCWVGKTDLNAAAGEVAGLGPIAMAATVRNFDEIHLLSNYEKKASAGYVKWLGGHTQAAIQHRFVTLTSPMNYGEIYEAAVDTLLELSRKGSKRWVFHLSPGTSAMAAVWIILARTRFPAELIESSLQSGVNTVDLPFEISADYLPARNSPNAEEILRLTGGLPPVPVFDKIIHRSEAMKRVIAKAQRISGFAVPVLILGESGTGKELFARAIHEASERANGPFVEVNCGAIPENLVESELFGHVAGAFTDAKHAREGYLERADGGTLFLDEIGELPLNIQVKLLRALQEGQIQRVGASKKTTVSFRIIAATHRNLAIDVSTGRFREDLFHRIAVGVLNLPPLRERPGDINLLVDYWVQRLQAEATTGSAWVCPTLSAGAKNQLHQHSWPGNIRELFNTITRAAIWATETSIKPEDIREAMFSVSRSDAPKDRILDRALGNGFCLQTVLDDVTVHYLKRAMTDAESKQAASELLGFTNTTTLTNWLKKYAIE